MRDDLLGDAEQLEEEVGFGEIMINQVKIMMIMINQGKMVIIMIRFCNIMIEDSVDGGDDVLVVTHKRCVVNHWAMG